MQLPNIFKALPLSETIVVRSRVPNNILISEDNWVGYNLFKEYFYPASDVSRQLTRLGARAPCTGPDWDMVDDLQGSPDDDTTYIEECSAGPGGADRYTKTASVNLISTDVIENVRLNARYRSIAGVTADINVRLIISGSLQTGNNDSTTQMTYKNFFFDWPLNPITGLKWTFTEFVTNTDLGIFAGFALDTRVTQLYAEVDFWDESQQSTIILITQVNGRVHFERVSAGSADHPIRNSFTATDWSDYTHLRFKIDKVVYAGASQLTVALRSSDTSFAVNVGDYCAFGSSTEELICIIPLADFVTAGVDITIVEGVEFLTDGDNGDYDFFIDAMEVIELDDQGNDVLKTDDKDYNGFKDVGTGLQVPFEPGEVTETSATFYLPKDTVIDNNDHIVYNSEVYRVVGINDSFPTHLVIETVLREVWDDSNIP